MCTADDLAAAAGDGAGNGESGGVSDAAGGGRRVAGAGGVHRPACIAVELAIGIPGGGGDPHLRGQSGTGAASLTWGEGDRVVTYHTRPRDDDGCLQLRCQT